MTTIAEIVAQSGNSFDANNHDFDILLKAVQAAGLVDALNDSNADLTVFAPTDAAFIQLAQDLGFDGSDEAGAFDAIVAALTDLGGGDPIPLLTDILLYHVSPEAKTLETIEDAASVTTLLDGATLTPNGNSLIDNEPDLIDPSFVDGLTDIPADNGIVQVIDRVLIPIDIPGNEQVAPDDREENDSPAVPAPELTIAGIVAQSGTELDGNNQDFDILLQAVQAAGLVDALNDANADLTVFAPTDAAFIQLAQDLGFDGSDEAGAFDAIVAALTDLGGGDPIPLLTDILLYHVSPEAKTLETIGDAASVTTLLDGATLTPNGNSLIDNEPDLIDPSFVEELTDVQATNGIVQVIDRVLIPIDIPGNEQVAPDDQEEDGGNGTVIRGGRGDDVQDGSASHDTLIGSRGADTQNGNAGNDLLRGGRGDDIQNGGRGHDTLLGGRGADTQIGGGGDDLLRGGLGMDIQEGGRGNDRLSGGRGDDTQNGGRGHDTLIGGRGSDLQAGGQGSDSLRGGRGDDIQNGGRGHDTLIGGRGSDLQEGGVGDDVLRGDRGNDTLLGGRGDDILTGGRGNDILLGGPGHDTLTGGRGKDTFVLTVGEGSDRITDFNLAQDSLDLSGDLTFEQLTISQGVGDQSADTLISVTDTGEILAVLQNIDGNTLNQSVFDVAITTI